MESIPVVRYGGKLHLNEIPDSVARIDRSKKDARVTENAGHPRHTDLTVFAANLDEHDESKTFGNPDIPDYNIAAPSKANAAQSGERSGLSHELFSCSVCVEHFSESDNVRILPCGHTYHQICIDPWLLDFAGTCPMW